MTIEDTDPIRWKALLELRWHLDAQAEQYGWDQPSQLMSLHAVEYDGSPAVAAAPVPGWSFITNQFDEMQPAVWTMTQVLRGITPPRRERLLPATPVLGVMLLSEAWLLRDQQELAAGQRPATSPHRVETRMVILATPSTTSTLTHERDGAPVDLGADVAGGLGPLLQDFCRVLQELSSELPDDESQDGPLEEGLA